MKKSKIAAIIAFISIMLSVVLSCGSTGAPGIVSTDPSDKHSDSNAAPDKIEYKYPTLDCCGETFTFLNSTTTWGFYTYIDFENLTGDTLDDVVFNRNRFIEEKFNVNFEVIEDDIDTCFNLLQTAVLAGDNIYDAAFCRGDKLSPFILEGYLANLLDYPEFQVDEVWWDQSVMAQALISDKLYFASTDLSLVGFDGSICMFFNDDMLNDLGLDAPYNLVRDGTWTLDRLNEYMKAGANLNGDESYTWKLDGSCHYGLTTWSTGVGAMIIGANEFFINFDNNKQPMFAIENNRFYDVAAKIASLCSNAGEYLCINVGGTEEHYEMIFKAGRALFLCAELKASSKFRDMNQNYGVLPMPKYDENQEGYHSFRFSGSLLLSIPVTNMDIKRAGIIIDALTYKSYAEVLPIYYDINVSQKGLRNDDSIEMLGVIRDSRYFDIGLAYGWTTSIYTSIRDALNVGNAEIASIIAANKDTVNENIKKTMELIG